MMDMKENEKRERVIKGLECIVSSGNAGMRDDCANCVYPGGGDCLAPALQDALALLKAQEPQLVIVSRDYIEGTVLRCPKCKEVVHKYNGNYCPHCGQAVKWE